MGSIWPTDDPHFSNSGTGRAGKTLQVPSPGTAGFVTDLEVETLKPLYIGDRVSQVSQVLLDVNPRKTRVGDGAFLVFERRVAANDLSRPAIGVETEDHFDDLIGQPGKEYYFGIRHSIACPIVPPFILHIFTVACMGL